jgi:hypothetical protein
MAYEGDRQSHITHTLTEVGYAPGGVGSRSRRLEHFTDSDSVIRLNGRTAEEVLAIYKAIGDLL